jgi:hypothetical protein
MIFVSDCLSIGLAILTIFVAGGVVFYGVVREPERFFRGERIAYCFPLGMTALSLALFLMSVAGMRLHAVVVIGGVVASAVLVRLVRGSSFKEFWLKRDNLGTEQTALDEFEWLVILIIVACLGARTIACLITPLTDWDSLNNWGIRSKLLYCGTIRSYDDYFRGAEFRYLNQTYPLLWPFMYAWMCTVLGRWDDVRMCAINPLNLIVFCLLVYFTVRKFVARKVAMVVTAMVASLPASMHYTECGQADIPIMLLGGSSLCCLLAWMRERRQDSLLLAAVLMGGALFAKTEGQVVFGAQFCAAILSVLVFADPHGRGKGVRQVFLYLIVALLLYAPWLIYRSTLPHEAWMVGGRVMGHTIRWAGIPEFLKTITANAFPLYNQYGLPKWNLLWIILPLFFVLSKSTRQYPWMLLLVTFLIHAVGIMFVELMSQERLDLHSMEAAYERYTLVMLPPLWLLFARCLEEWRSFW